jgi:hypothetical protein
MKGIIFTELVDLIEARYGLRALQETLDAAQLASGGAYTAVGTYDSEELFAIVDALAARTGRTRAEWLRAFGRHLFGRFHLRYPELLQQAGDALTLVERVESHIHANVRKLYPDAALPTFRCERPEPGTLLVEYRSERPLAIEGPSGPATQFHLRSKVPSVLDARS